MLLGGVLNKMWKRSGAFLASVGGGAIFNARPEADTNLGLGSSHISTVWYVLVQECGGGFLDVIFPFPHGCLILYNTVSNTCNNCITPRWFAMSNVGGILGGHPERRALTIYIVKRVTLV